MYFKLYSLKKIIEVAWVVGSLPRSIGLFLERRLKTTEIFRAIGTLNFKLSNINFWYDFHVIRPNQTHASLSIIKNKLFLTFRRQRVRRPLQKNVKTDYFLFILLLLQSSTQLIFTKANTLILESISICNSVRVRPSRKNTFFLFKFSIIKF